MGARFRITAALIFMVLAVLVDFTSRILSVASDGVMIMAAIYLMLPVIQKGCKE
ncbi:TPA: DUF3927 family protein [Raoultella planticola]